MVGCEIQQYADFGAKRVDGFELETADFGDGDRRVRGRFGDREQRRADIAADERGDVRGPENMRDERRGGGLAVRARDGYKGAAQKAPSEFDLTPHGNALLAREFELRQVCRNTRAQNDQILFEERHSGMSAER